MKWWTGPSRTFNHSFLTSCGMFMFFLTLNIEMLFIGKSKHCVHLVNVHESCSCKCFTIKVFTFRGISSTEDHHLWGQHFVGDSLYFLIAITMCTQIKTEPYAYDDLVLKCFNSIAARKWAHIASKRNLILTITVYIFSIFIQTTPNMSTNCELHSLLSSRWSLTWVESPLRNSSRISRPEEAAGQV